MRVLWKVVSVGSAVCPVAEILTFWQAEIHDYSFDRLFEMEWSDAEGVEILLITSFWIFFLLHIVFRIILIVLIFLAFRNVPPEIYDTRSWLAFLPSIH